LTGFTIELEGVVADSGDVGDPACGRPGKWRLTKEAFGTAANPVIKMANRVKDSGEHRLVLSP